MTDYIYADFEGTETGELISIGAVYKNKTFYSLVCPSKLEDVTPRITELTGLTVEVLKTARPAKEVMKEFFECFPEDVKICVYGNYDKYMINNTPGYNDVIRKNISNRITNVSSGISLACGSRGKGNLISLQKAGEITGVDTSDIQFHNALDDAVLLSRVMGFLLNMNFSELFEYCGRNLAKDHFRYIPNNEEFRKAVQKAYDRLYPCGWCEPHRDNKPSIFPEYMDKALNAMRIITDKKIRRKKILEEYLEL